MWRICFRFGVSVLAAFWLVGCSGGSSGDGSSGRGGTDVSGLEIASQMSLVEAQSEATPSISRGFKAPSLKALTSDAATAYYTDPLDVWVFDDSMQSLSIINEILCSFDQTGYASMVNRGPYVALINNTLCDKRSDKSSDSSNQSTGADAAEYETWVVDSQRASNSADQIVSVWVDQEASEYEPAMMIHGKATIREGVSQTNSFGKFHVDFAMLDPNEEQVYAQGYLETVDRTDGQVEFQFSMSGLGAEFPVSEAVHVVTDADGVAGYAYASHSFGEFDSGEYRVAFDHDHYRAQAADGGDARCLDRQNFTSHTFRYGVYGEDGSRLEIANPGFGITYGSGEEQVYGFVGYYGIWLPDEVPLVSGLTVARERDGEASEYTTVVVPGKFVRHTKEEITLGDIRDAYLKSWDEGTNSNSRVIWNGENFVKVGRESCSENAGCTWQDVDPDEVMSLTPGQWVDFWRDGIGGLFFEVPESALSDATPITFDKNEILTAAAADFASGPLTLYCYEMCLDANIAAEQINWQDGQSPFMTNAEDVESPYMYVIDPADMTLRYGEEPVVIVDGVTASGQNAWGVNSGPLVTSTEGFADVWEAWDQAVYYTWETGPNQWNKFSGLLDAGGVPVAFDPPVSLLYTHTDGIKYLLDFQGHGELSGIPWQQVEGTDRWYPQITISDGSSATADDGTIYYIRALEKEQQMSLVDEALCSELASESLAIPPSTYTDPGIGNRPDISSDPAVIGGDIVGD